MKRRMTLTLVTLMTLMLSLFNVMPVGANPPYPEDQTRNGDQTAVNAKNTPASKNMDQPNPLEVMRLRARQELLKQGDYAGAAELSKLGADDHVLVVLVEYAGTDTFTWTPGASTWDPIGQANTAESADPGDCSNVVGIPDAPTDFTYGPTLHNTIPQPVSAADASGTTIWTPDFSNEWFTSFMFGNGVVFDYDRTDASHVHEDFTGKSVVNYYHDMSGGAYNFSGDVIGWIQLPHSAWWYGADQCPGARSNASGVARANAYGAIPGAGTAKSLVQDSLAKIEELRADGQLPGFNWADYDPDGNNVIDRLWIVHSGYGEEDSTTLTNRTNYGEAAIWSHSSSIGSYTIPGTAYTAGPYIMMPENGGIGVFAHEYGHNLGAADLYAYTGGETSAGFWTLMADDWTGYPLGYMPPAVDPWHLDNWGWLNPTVISDPTQVYTVTVGQASDFPEGTDAVRGVKIELPDGRSPLAIPPNTGNYGWWGGKQDETNATMTLKDPIAVPAGGATLSFDIAYGLETEWDYLFVQASTDGGANWNILTNADTTCSHDVGWIGEDNGLPADMCAAGVGGFTDYNANFPSYDPESFDLDAATYGGQNVTLRFWYMTDWGTTYEGPFIDNVSVDAVSPAANLFSDGAETDGNWDFVDPFQRTDGTMAFNHNLYLQWRNTSATGGYDAGLGDPRYRYGPVGGGLLVWYNNDFYSDNEVGNYLTDFPSYGTKGKMLVMDANPEPVRSPYAISQGYNNEVGNLPSRSQMRDAAFNQDSGPNFIYNSLAYSGKPGVSFFDDSLGYYPGAEYTSRGPGYNPPSLKWITKQWDASAVTPAKGYYPFNAPGYKPNDELRYWCALSAVPGRIGCYYYGAATGLGYSGGTGNPGDYAVQYGWHVDILSHTDTTATLRIYNANGHTSFAPTLKLVPSGLPSLTYNFDVTGAPVDGTVFACADLNPEEVQYAFGTNVLALPNSCDAVTPLALHGGSLATVSDPSQVKSVAVFKPVNAGDDVASSFTVIPLNDDQTIYQSINVYDNGIHRVYEADKVATFETTYHSFWPMVMGDDTNN